ncbi:MAG: hypothetical protein HYS38_08400 [Acidobacteria bacterium]|nr:hypothetical protein [Acidobacteriota bacterium]
MILSDAEIEKQVINVPHEVEEGKGWWARNEWEKIQERILIDPFHSQNINTISYELTVGPEVVWLRDADTVRQLAPGDVITVAPHETVLVLSEEYIALPRTIAALVVPRARKLFEGCPIAATRVDPTWYGRLLISFTNLSQYNTRLARGEKFCNLIFMQAHQVSRSLSESNTPHLGRTRIGKLEYPSMRQQRLKLPEEISGRDVQELVDSFGAPFDVVRGALQRTRDETIRHVEKDLGPRMVDNAVKEAVRRAFRTQQWMFGILLAEFGTLVGGVLFFLFKR